MSEFYKTVFLKKDKEEIDAELSEKIKKTHKIYKSNDPTHIFVYSYGKNNGVLKIATKLEPINGYVYNFHESCYIVSGIDYKYVGKLDFSLYMESGTWFKRIPIPECVFLNLLDEKSVNVIDDFKKEFSDCKIDYVQFIGN